MQTEPKTLLAIADYRISWVLDHPHMSGWLKDALRSARTLDPVEAQNAVEMLRHLILPRATAQIELALSGQPDGQAHG